MTELDMDKLPEIIPCPHCQDGGHPKLTTWADLELLEEEGEEPVFTVVCAVTEGGSGATGGCAGDPKMAIELWNMRSPLGYRHATWYGVPYDEACRVLRKALMERGKQAEGGSR